MPVNTSPIIPTCEVRRIIRAPRDKVFHAWTNAEEIARFHAPGPMTVSKAEVDLRVGGAFRIHMRAPDGVEHRVTGVYQEVDPPSRVVYSWNWEGRDEAVGSVVTVEFHEHAAGTEVVLRHDGIVVDTERNSHGAGWNAILDKLVTTCERD